MATKDAALTGHLQPQKQHGGRRRSDIRRLRQRVAAKRRRNRFLENWEESEMEIMNANGRMIIKFDKTEFGILSTCIYHVRAGLSEGDFLNEIGGVKDIVIESDEIFDSIIDAQLKEMGRL